MTAYSTHNGKKIYYSYMRQQWLYMNNKPVGFVSPEDIKTINR